MFTILCPFCQARIEIPANAIGEDRTDEWNVVRCDECGVTFDYDDDEVIAESLPPVSGEQPKPAE